MIRTPLVLCVLILSAWSARAAAPTERDLTLRQTIDDYLDRRFQPLKEGTEATKALADKLRSEKLSVTEVEKLLRGPRVKYAPVPERGKLTFEKLECDHVDYQTTFFLYVPKSYDYDKPAPLLLVGHGGNSAMSRDYATRTARTGVQPLIDEAEKNGVVLAAPVTERGWGWIGDSVLLSTLSQVQRRFNIDPDRVYVTGHSMGGHLSYRSGIFMPDRWGAIAPMSGGYDYVENKQIYNLVNVPGYATYGTREPFEINTFNNKMKEWAGKRDYDWVFAEKTGGHTIFDDETPKVFKFLLDHPRNLYRTTVYARNNGRLVHDRAEENAKWDRKHTWTAGRVIDRSTVHWLRLVPLDDATAVQTIKAEIVGRNRIEITASKAKAVRLYLHPRMVDFEKPLVVTVNGKKVFEQKPEARLERMLDLVREFDDRGRIFHAMIEVPVAGDADVPEPLGTKPTKGK